jgi:hypothetical protein
MAEPHLSSPNGDRPVADSPRSLDQRKDELAETLRKKLEQRSQIETQTDTATTSIEPARTLLRFRDEPIARDADATLEAAITEPHLPSPNGDRPTPDSLVSLDQRKERLAETLRKKVEQGYQIESQTDTDAILVTKGRRRWFGILGGDAGTRQSTSIDEQGRATTRTL